MNEETNIENERIKAIKEFIRLMELKNKVDELI